MFKRIMAAIDGSETSRETLMEAKRMAVSRHATRRIVYAVSDSEDVDQKAGFKLLAQAKSAVGSEVAAETHVLYADAIYGLTGIVEAVADAANGGGKLPLSRAGTMIIGSVAEQLITMVDASVLLVRPH